MARTPLEVRYGRPFHLVLAVLAFGLTAAVGIYLATISPAEIKAENQLVIFGISAAGLVYYGVRSTRMLLNRQPQIVVGREGLWLGFGRDILIDWSDIQWTRVRGLRPMLQLGVSPEVFARLRLSVWNLDDNLGTVRGGGSAVGIRGNGLDTSVVEIHEAIGAWRPDPV